MKRVAKLIIIDQKGNYLLLWRGTHPKFGQDPDLPGGTAEKGEAPLKAMLREVVEEIGATVDTTDATERYAGIKYSRHLTKYYLYTVRVQHRPKITLSWEHTSYEWLSHEKFLKQVRGAKDTYMQMVYAVLKQGRAL